MGGFLTWDFVTLLSIAMALGSVSIITYLCFKVVQLMRRDAARHSTQASADESVAAHGGPVDPDEPDRRA